MGAITFESAASTLSLRNPFNGFDVEEHRVEVRRDPILGDTSVLNRYQQNKTGFSGENDREFIARLVEKSAETCIFCGERLGARTARYPDDLIPGGQLTRGEATLMPNLFALGAYHPLVVLARAHFLELAEFTPALLADGLGAAREFLNRVHQRDPAAVFTAVGANYLPPAGASLIHPHLQMLVTPVAYTHHERLLQACRRHHERHGGSCLDDLAREERRLGQRFVAHLGGWNWMTAFAPQGCNEILAVHESEQDFAALPDEGVQALAAGISQGAGLLRGARPPELQLRALLRPAGNASRGLPLLLPHRQPPEPLPRLPQRRLLPAEAAPDGRGRHPARGAGAAAAGMLLTA